MQAGVVWLSITLLGVGVVHADEGRFRIGVNGALVTFESLAVGSGDDRLSGTETRFSVLDPGLGVNVAYAPIATVVVGAHLSLSTSSVDVEDSSSSSHSLLLLPFVEYTFSPGLASRPYVEVMFGLDTSSTDSGAEVSSTAYVFGAGIGLHLFPTPSFSIDPELAVLTRIGSVDFSLGGGEDSRDTSSLSLVLLVGLSGWTGAPAPSPSAQPDLQQAPAPPPSPPTGSHDEQGTGVLVEDLPLAGAHLTARVGVAGHVELTLTVPSDDPRLEATPNLGISTTAGNATTGATHYAAEPLAQSVEERLRAEVPAGDLLALGASSSAELTAGSSRWTIDAAAWQRLLRFAASVYRIRSRHLRGPARVPAADAIPLPDLLAPSR